jgi:hypothetical protein
MKACLREMAHDILPETGLQSKCANFPPVRKPEKGGIVKGKHRSVYCPDDTFRQEGTKPLDRKGLRRRVPNPIRKFRKTWIPLTDFNRTLKMKASAVLVVRASNASANQKSCILSATFAWEGTNTK